MRSTINSLIVMSVIPFFIALFLVSNSAFASKCLYVSSYHVGYEWNDGIERGIEKTLSGECELDRFYMDTKTNKSPEFAKRKALEAKKYIEDTSPDIVIACDDNASKYLVKPYFRDAKLPIVFCGINWSVKNYEYPYSNVTGIVEISPIEPLLKTVQGILGQVKNVIYLGPDVISQRKEFKLNQQIYNKKGIEVSSILVKNFVEWKAAIKKAQKADYIIMGNNGGINDWNHREAVEFVLKENRKLSVTNYDWMAAYAVLTMSKVAEEQGEWAAATALAVLQGESIAEIPIVVNRRWNITLNSELHEKIGIDLPDNLIRKSVKFKDNR